MERFLIFKIFVFWMIFIVFLAFMGCASLCVFCPYSLNAELTEESFSITFEDRAGKSVQNVFVCLELSETSEEAALPEVFVIPLNCTCQANGNFFTEVHLEEFFDDGLNLDSEYELTACYVSRIEYEDGSFFEDFFGRFSKYWN